MANSVCYTCNRSFRLAKQLWLYQDQWNHFDYECLCCDLTFPTDKDRHEHQALDHDMFFCWSCDIEFNSLNALRMHERSRVHLFDKDRVQVYCPFCDRDFGTATGLIIHLERSSCPEAGGITRKSLFYGMWEYDRFSKFFYPLEDYIPDQNRQLRLATEQAWNGQAYVCRSCSRKFNSLEGLNYHRQSPAHKQMLYLCAGKGCGYKCQSLGSLINHLESERCGHMRFTEVQRRVINMFYGHRQINPF